MCVDTHCIGASCRPRGSVESIWSVYTHERTVHGWWVTIDNSNDNSPLLSAPALDLALYLTIRSLFILQCTRRGATSVESTLVVARPSKGIRPRL